MYNVCTERERDSKDYYKTVSLLFDTTLFLKLRCIDNNCKQKVTGAIYVRDFREIK